MAMMVVMVMVICEEVAVVFGGRMVGRVSKEECEEQAGTKRRHVVVGNMAKSGGKGSRLFWGMRAVAAAYIWTATAATRT